MYDFDRYSRQTMLSEISIEGQTRLSQATVLIVGLGGLGSVVSTYLVGAGCGHIILADSDTVSISNLQRQVLYTEAEVGLPKTDCARNRLSSQSSNIVFETVEAGLTAENAENTVAKADIVVDCTDNYATRFLIDDVCTACNKPWVYGSIGEFKGQLALFNYKSGIHYADLYPDRESLCNLPRKLAGVIGSVPAVIGALQANEVIKFITGAGQLLDGKLFTIDLLTLQTQIFTL